MADVPAPAAPQAAPAQPARMRVSQMASAMAAQLAAPDGGVRPLQSGVQANIDVGPGSAKAEIPDWARGSVNEGPGKELLDPEDNALGDTEPDAFGDEQPELDEQGQPQLDYRQEYEKLRALADSEDVPEDWLESKFVTKKINGQPVRMSIKESLQGHMTEREFSFRNAQLKQFQQQVQSVHEGQQRWIGDLDNPQTLIEAHRSIGKLGTAPRQNPDGSVDFNTGSGLMGAVAILADQMWQEHKLRSTNPEAYKIAMEKRALQEQNWQAQQQLRQHQMQLQQAQQQQAPQPSQQEQVWMHQLSQMVPVALKRVGLTVDPFVEKVFNAHYEQLLPLLDGDLNTDFVVRVARATKETVDAMRQDAAKRPPATNGMPPANAGMAGGGTVPRQPGQAPPQQRTNGQVVRKRVSEMGAHFSRRQ